VHLANIESRDRAAHHRTPSLATLERLARALGVSVAELLS
jgi:transcriptional regulator with XRE-family HTH domain